MQNFSKEELISQIKDLQEQLQKIKKQKKYGIVWEEKAENIDKNKLPMLEEDKELRIENDKNKPQNLIIEWDNFHALSVLQNTHKGKIDVIYIDPPYNTGNKDFIYNDDYVDKEDTYRHSKWLSFMQKRRELSKNLLKNDWVIFISIDDNEFAQLKLLCDEIFGEKNFISDFIRKTKSTTNDAKTWLNYQHEFLLCYAKNKNFINLLWWEKDLSRYSNPDNDPNWEWISDNPSAKSGTKENNYFAVKNPYTWKEDLPPTWRFWLFSKNTLQKHINYGTICFKKEHKENERWFIYKRYKKDLKTTALTFDSLSFVNNEFMNQVATKELLHLWMADLFAYPKWANFLKKIIQHSSQPNSIILDFFAWSGTTGHAVMELNKEDWWNRQFILCSNRENTKENPEKNICHDITYERNKRVIQGYTNAKWEQIEGLGGNLRYYKTTFINKNPSIDDLCYSFIHKCDDLLCIKENTFTKVSFGEEIEEIKIFHNKNHFTVILYDMLYFAKAKEILELFPDKEISFYAFSMSKTMITEEIAHIWKNIVLENIPDEILETYEKIFGL